MSDEQAPAVSARGEGAGDAERYAKVRERWDALTDKQRANRISWFREFHRVDQEMSDWDIIPPDLFCQCEHSWPCDPVVLLAANDRLERDLAAAPAPSRPAEAMLTMIDSLAQCEQTGAEPRWWKREGVANCIEAAEWTNKRNRYGGDLPLCVGCKIRAIRAALAEARGEPGGEKGGGHAEDR
jgi:hypothetical protein